MDFSTLDPQEIYKLFIGSITPRPIAWVATISEEGVPNLAPFSYFTIASVNPPMLAFNPLNTPDGFGGIRKKDTVNNLKATKECVIHIVSYEMAEQMNISSGNFAPNISEFTEANIESVASQKVKVPRIKAAKIAFEAKLHQVIGFGELALGGNLCIVEILYAHFADDVLADGKINLEVLDPIARLGGNFYSRTKESVFELNR